MVSRSPALGVVRATIVKTSSAFLRNVRRIPGSTCAVCGGVTANSWPTCWSCYQRAGQAGVADVAGFVTYAWDGHQTGRTMYTYKTRPPGATSRDLVRSLLAYALVAHWGCIGVHAGSQPDGWAYVPSLSGRPGEHPLQQLAASALGQIPRVPVAATRTPVQPRSFRPDNFVVEVAPQRHMLLLEGSWVTGGRAQSVSAALKAAGAQRVTTLAVARWLTPDFADTEAFMKSLTVPFDPDICPYISRPC